MDKKITSYINLLKTYNKHTNIYSKKAYDSLDFHINDSIALAHIIGNTPLTIFDFGTGSGLPIIPISILNNQNKLWAIESKSRKTTFLELVKKELNLKNLSIITKNIIEWAPPITPNIITAKAFASLEKIEWITQKLSLKNVTIYIPISKKQEEIYKKRRDITIIHKDSYRYILKTIT